LKNDEFQITRREFIDAHIEELIILQKFEDARKASLTLKKDSLNNDIIIYLFVKSLFYFSRL